MKKKQIKSALNKFYREDRFGLHLKILYSIGQDSGNISAVEKSLTFLKIYNLLILRIYNSGYNNHRNSWTINYKLNI